MSAVTDAFAGFQTALTDKLTAMQGDSFFELDASDNTGGTIKTTKNVKVIGDVTARGDLLGNEDIT